MDQRSTEAQADILHVPTLANHLAGATVFEGVAISAEFSSLQEFDFSTVDSPSFDEESLYTTAVHELMHGLGFFSEIFEDGSFFDWPTIFDTFLGFWGQVCA